MSERLDGVLEALLVGLLALCVYLLTLAPGITWSHWCADGGDLLTAALTGRLAHPPGFPVYLALAELAVRLPGGTPAWRMNLLSAAAGAGAAAVVTLTLRQRGRTILVAMAVGATLAFAPLLWSQSLITEVYAVAALAVALNLWWWTRGREAPTRRWAFLGGLSWGLGLSVHPVLIFSFPLWLSPRGISWVHLGAGLSLGLLPYALLPLRGPWPQPWGDLRWLLGWGEYVSARLYWGYAFGLPLRFWPRRLLAWASVLARQFTPVGAVVAGWGLARLRWRDARFAWGSALALGGVSLYAIGYDTTDSLVYLVPFLPLVALWLGEGMGALAERGVPRGLWLLLPAALLAWQAGEMDLSNEAEARRWLGEILDSAPRDAVLVTEEDAHTFTLWYALEGLGARPDLLVVDRGLWGWERYRAFVSRQAGVEVSEPEEWAGERPVCRVEASRLVCGGEGE
jgi:hypothetical protein